VFNPELRVTESKLTSSHLTGVGSVPAGPPHWRKDLMFWVGNPSKNQLNTQVFKDGDEEDVCDGQ